MFLEGQAAAAAAWLAPLASAMATHTQVFLSPPVGHAQHLQCLVALKVALAAWPLQIAQWRGAVGGPLEAAGKSGAISMGVAAEEGLGLAGEVAMAAQAGLLEEGGGPPG